LSGAQPKGGHGGWDAAEVSITFEVAIL